MKRWISLALALMLACGWCFAGAAEGEYPTEWDLTKLYENEEAWQADYDKVMEMLPHHEDFRGTLNTAQGLYDYYQWAYMGELTDTQVKLQMYAMLGYNLNPADPQFTNMQMKLDVMNATENELSAFATPEIYALPLEQRQAMLEDPLLKPWAYALRDLADPEREPFSEETYAVLAKLSPALWRAESIFNVLDSVDLPFPTITMPDGTEAELTDELYAEIVYGNTYDREFKALCNQTLLTRYVPFVNTFAALLESTMTSCWASAQINKYETSREAALDINDVEPEIYDMIIEAAHKGAPDYQRFLNAHRRGLRLEEQYPFDMATYVSDFSGDTAVPYEDAVKQVREALSVLGEDYLSKYDTLISSGCLDVYPSDTKVTGAFSYAPSPDYLPYMLFNYVGYGTQSISTIAHEMGHSIYSMYSAKQDKLNYSPGIFTQEVASTTNELLFYLYKIENAATDDECLFYLEDLLNTFSGAFFMQVLYAEFEDAAYQIVEAGGSLDAEGLSDLWANLYKTYRGDSIVSYPDARYQWAGVPHFHYNYYVYQYATAITYAASICERIMNGEEGAVEDYLSFLSLGCSAKPSELLSVAGVDPLNSKTYDAALAFFSELVDEYERLVENKLAAE